MMKMKKVMGKTTENIGEFLSGKEFKKSSIMAMFILTVLYTLVSHRLDGEITNNLLDFAKFIAGSAVGMGGLNVVGGAIQGKRDSKSSTAYNDDSRPNGGK